MQQWVHVYAVVSCVLYPCLEVSSQKWFSTWRCLQWYPKLLAVVCIVDMQHACKLLALVCTWYLNSWQVKERYSEKSSMSFISPLQKRKVCYGVRSCFWFFWLLGCSCMVVFHSCSSVSCFWCLQADDQGLVMKVCIIVDSTDDQILQGTLWSVDRYSLGTSFHSICEIQPCVMHTFPATLSMMRYRQCYQVATDHSNVM
jgi:hypothetical protein